MMTTKVRMLRSLAVLEVLTQYIAPSDSAYIFIGGLNQELTEGDVITIFSQYVPCMRFLPTC